MDGIDLKNFCGGALQEKVNEAAKQVFNNLEGKEGNQYQHFFQPE